MLFGIEIPRFLKLRPRPDLMRKLPRKPQAVIAKQPILTDLLKVTRGKPDSFAGRMYPVFRLVDLRPEITWQGGFRQDYCFLASFEEIRPLRMD